MTFVDSPVMVYNFQVEDYHTYFVGENCILVHNRGYENFEDIPRTGKPGSPEWKETLRNRRTRLTSTKQERAHSNGLSPVAILNTSPKTVKLFFIRIKFLLLCIIKIHVFVAFAVFKNIISSAIINHDSLRNIISVCFVWIDF